MSSIPFYHSLAFPEDEGGLALSPLSDPPPDVSSPYLRCLGKLFGRSQLHDLYMKQITISVPALTQQLRNSVLGQLCFEYPRKRGMHSPVTSCCSLYLDSTLLLGLRSISILMTPSGRIFRKISGLLGNTLHQELGRIVTVILLSPRNACYFLALFFVLCHVSQKGTSFIDPHELALCYHFLNHLQRIVFHLLSPDQFIDLNISPNSDGHSLSLPR